MAVEVFNFGNEYREHRILQFFDWLDEHIGTNLKNNFEDYKTFDNQVKQFIINGIPINFNVIEIGPGFIQLCITRNEIVKRKPIKITKIKFEMINEIKIEC